MDASRRSPRAMVSTTLRIFGLGAVVASVGCAAHTYSYEMVSAREERQLSDSSRLAWLVERALEPLAKMLFDAAVGCKDSSAIAEPQMIKLALRISRNGTISDVTAHLSTSSTACLATALVGQTLPPPPFEIYMTVPINVERQDATGPIGVRWLADARAASTSPI